MGPSITYHVEVALVRVDLHLQGTLTGAGLYHNAHMSSNSSETTATTSIVFSC